MSVREQVCEECEALDRFQHASGELPGTVMRGAEPPDFVIDNGGRRIAVEMTRYHQQSGRKGSPHAKHESLEHRVVLAAKTQFEGEHSDAYVTVQPHFRPGSLDPRTVPLTAGRLARLVWKVLPAEPIEKRLESRRATWDEISDAGLGDSLINLFVMRLSPRYAAMQGNSWVRVSGYVSADTEHLESVIRVKERDVPRYRKAADECWLIIYAPPHRASGFFDLDVLQPAMWTSTFDRVVFLDVLWARYVMVV